MDFETLIKDSLATEIMSSAPVGISIADPSCAEIRHNPVAAEFLRIRPWDQLSHSSDTPPPVKILQHGKELSATEMPIQTAARYGKEIKDVELEFVWGDGVRKTALWNASPLFNQGKVAGVVATFKEITEQKRTDEIIRQQNSILTGSNRIFEEAMKCDTEEELRKTCLAVAKDVTESRIGFIGEFDREGKFYDITFSDPGDGCQMAGKNGHRKPPAQFKINGLSRQVLLDGQPFFTNDPPSHPNSTGLTDGHIPLNAFLGVPLIHEDRIIGMIGLGNRAGGYRQQDMDVAMALSSAVGQAFIRKRAEMEVRRLTEQLEQRVRQRTEELTKANVKLIDLATRLSDDNRELAAKSKKLETEIDRRKQSEIELRAAEQKTIDILESISDAFYTLDLEWRFTYINLKAQSQMGIKNASEVIGRVIWEKFPNYKNLLYEMFHRAVAEQSPVRFELYSEITGKWHNVHAYPSAHGLSAYFLDINELKETWLELQRSQWDISDILNSVSDPFLALDGQWRVSYVNQVFTAKFGGEQGEILGRNLLDVFPSLPATDVHAACFKTMTEKVPVYADVHLASKNTWFELGVYPRQDGITIYARDITYKKQMEATIAATLEFNQAILESLPLGINIFNSSGRCIFANDAGARIAGGTRDQMLQLNINKLDSWKRTDLLSAARLVLSNGTSEHLSISVLSSFGKHAWFDCRLSRFLSGEEPCLLQVYEDITERKRLEAAIQNDITELKEIREKLEKSQQMLSVYGRDIVLFIRCSDGRIVDANEAAVKEYGYSHAELLEMTIQELRKGDDLRSIWGRATGANETDILFETHHTRKDGSTFPVEVSSKGTTINGDQIMLQIIRNILLRRQQEEKLLLANEVFENTPEGLVVIGGDGVIQRINNAFTTITGYGEDDVTGQQIDVLRYSLADLSAGPIEGEAWNKRKDGTSYLGRFILSVLCDEEGKIFQYVKSFSDITKQDEDRRARQLLQERQNRLQRLSTLSALSAGIVHEIAQPLNAIKLSADSMLYLYRHGLFKLKDFFESIKDISDLAEQANALIKQIRNFANASHQYEETSCDLNLVIGNVMHVFGRQLANHQIVTRIEAEVGLPGVIGTMSGYEEVVINLVSNAIHALDSVTKPGKELVIRTFSGNKLAVIEVADNATGISAEIIERIFEPLFTTKKAGEGMGLGLSIIQSIIEKFNGKVDVHNNADGGATFTIQLPIILDNKK